MTPMYFLPYMVFSPQAPQASRTECSGSARSTNGRPYLARNLPCDTGLSGLIPAARQALIASQYQYLSLVIDLGYALNTDWRSLVR